MPHSFTTMVRNLILLAGVACSCLSSQLPIRASDPANDGPVEERSPSNAASRKPTRGFTSRDTSRPPAAREWNRSQTRSASPKATIRETFPIDAAASVPESKIQFVSASGAEDGNVAPTKTAEAKSDIPEISPRAELPRGTSQSSVKEQLLNALRAQREAMIRGSESPARPGSLTIFHAPGTTADTLEPPDAQSTTTSDAPAGRPPNVDPFHSTLPDTSLNDVAGSATSSAANNSRVGLTRPLEADLQSTDPFVRERAQRYLRLEQQLLKLQASQAAAAELPTAREELLSSQPEFKESQRINLPNSLNAEVPSSVLSAESDAMPQNEADTRGEPDSRTSTESNTAIRENIVVDGPIDRLGLANNLFAVGQYPLALEMYEQASAETLTPHQKFWVEYQTANCLRRLEKKGEASQRYRKLANQPEAGWLSQQARWWVETLEKIRILESTLAEHAAENHRASVEEIETRSTHAENAPQPSAPVRSIQKESQPDAIAH